MAVTGKASGMGVADVLIADFPSADSGRAAVVELERRGLVDADRVRLEGVSDPLEEGHRRSEDAQAGRLVGRRALIGGGLGSLVGAAVGAGLSVLIGMDPQPTAAIACAMGVALFIGALSAYYAVGSGLPVTGGALEAVDTVGPGGVRLVVDLDRHIGEDRVRARLEACGASRVARARR
jgi:hypothetical protein